MPLFYTNTKPYKNKFDPRAIKCLFLGYVYAQKGYKVYNFNTHQLHVSCDVIFYENHFLFKSNPPTDGPSSPPPLPLYQILVSTPDPPLHVPISADNSSSPLTSSLFPPILISAPPPSIPPPKKVHDKLHTLYGSRILLLVLILHYQ